MRDEFLRGDLRGDDGEGFARGMMMYGWYCGMVGC